MSTEMLVGILAALPMLALSIAMLLKVETSASAKRYRMMKRLEADPTVSTDELLRRLEEAFPSNRRVGEGEHRG